MWVSLQCASVVSLLLLPLVLSTVENDIAEAERLLLADLGDDRTVGGATAAALRSIEANALCRLVLPHHMVSSTFSIDAASTTCSVDGAARALRVAFDIVESDAETACNDALHHERLWNPPPQPGFEVQLFNETAFDSALTAAGTVQIGECRTATTRHFRVEFALPLIDISARETTYAVEALLRTRARDFWDSPFWAGLPNALGQRFFDHIHSKRNKYLSAETRNAADAAFPPSFFHAIENTKIAIAVNSERLVRHPASRGRWYGDEVPILHVTLPRALDPAAVDARAALPFCDEAEQISPIGAVRGIWEKLRPSAESESESTEIDREGALRGTSPPDAATLAANPNAASMPGSEIPDHGVIADAAGEYFWTRGGWGPANCRLRRFSYKAQVLAKDVDAATGAVGTRTWSAVPPSLQVRFFHDSNGHNFAHNFWKFAVRGRTPVRERGSTWTTDPDYVLSTERARLAVKRNAPDPPYGSRDIGEVLPSGAVFRYRFFRACFCGDGLSPSILYAGERSRTAPYLYDIVQSHLKDVEASATSSATSSADGDGADAADGADGDSVLPPPVVDSAGEGRESADGSRQRRRRRLHLVSRAALNGVGAERTMLISSTLSQLGQELELDVSPAGSSRGSCGTEAEAIAPPREPGALCRKVLFGNGFSPDDLNDPTVKFVLVLASSFWMPLYKDIDYAISFADGLRAVLHDCEGSPATAALRARSSVLFLTAPATSQMSSPERERGKHRRLKTHPWRQLGNDRLVKFDRIILHTLLHDVAARRPLLKLHHSESEVVDRATALIDAVVPVHAFTRSMRGVHNNGDRLHQSEASNFAIAEMILNYALWAHKHPREQA